MTTTNPSKNISQWATFMAAAACLALSSCGNKAESDSGLEASGATNQKATIQNKGSDTMVNLALRWAEEYQKANPAVEIEVSGGGSGVGFAALIKGTIDLANASRPIRPAEAELVKKNTGKEAREYIVGYDALAIYVHKDNPLNEITTEQLAAIYGEDGHISKWSQLGVKVVGCGNDAIVRVSRQASSGTYEFLHEQVLGNKNFKPGAREVNGSKEAVDLVASSPCAIGYSGMGYATPKVKVLKVANKQGQPAYAPNLETTRNKTYPLARSLLVYTVGEPAGALKHYLHWLMSDAGQQIVEKQGFVPVPSAAQGK